MHLIYQFSKYWIGLAFLAIHLNLPVATAQPADKESLLYRHLQAQANKHLAERAATRRATMNSTQVQAEVTRVHEWFKTALGPWPEKTPLNARVTGTIEGAGVKAEKILFESRPGYTVSAVLYRPNTPPPWPGVIVPCGHSANGKAAETYQRVSILLARSGMAALCYDPIGQGERLQALKPDGKPLFSGSTAEHTKIGNGSLMVGLQTAHYRVWDGIRALDYLASRPDIDDSRLGCTGNSGGGTLTSFLMAVDERIVAAAASCYLTSYERLLATIGPQDAEQNITGMIAAGLDHGDFLLARAPQPTMMTVATRDFFDIDGAWSTYREAKKLFGALGLGERVELFEFDDTHGFSMPRRVAATRWLRRWLLENNDAVTEPEFSIFTDAQLQASPAGQVLALPGEKSVFQINKELAGKLASQRQKNTGSRLTTVVRKRLGMEATLTPAQFRSGGYLQGEKRLQIGYYTTSDNFELVGIRMKVRGGRVVEGEQNAGDTTLTIIVGSDIPVKSWSVKSAEEFLAGDGKSVPDGDLLVLDVRGLGSSGGRPGASAKTKDPNGTDWREAELARLLGQNLVGLRTRDVLEVVGLEFQKSKDIGLVGLGRGSIWAVHAAFLNRNLKRLTEVDSPGTWAAHAGDAQSVLVTSDIVPGALQDYDLDQLRAGK